MTLDQKSVTELFKALGVKSGDCLMVHADSLASAQLIDVHSDKRMDALIDGIIDAIGGSQGTLVMPAFTYSATREELFDPVFTPSEVGQLTEVFRQRPGVLRSKHPIFSMAAIGNLATKVAESVITDCFGEGTAFDILFQENARIVCLGCSIDRVTFTHFVEQSAAVSYRYFKKFPARIQDTSGIISVNTRYFVRDLELDTNVRLNQLRRRLEQEKRFATQDLGRARMYCFKAKDFVKIANELLAKHPYALIGEGQ